MVLLASGAKVDRVSADKLDVPNNATSGLPLESKGELLGVWDFAGPAVSPNRAAISRCQPLSVTWRSCKSIRERVPIGEGQAGCQAVVERVVVTGRGIPCGGAAEFESKRSIHTPPAAHHQFVGKTVGSADLGQQNPPSVLIWRAVCLELKPCQNRADEGSSVGKSDAGDRTVDRIRAGIAEAGLQASVAICRRQFIFEA